MYTDIHMHVSICHKRTCSSQFSEWVEDTALRKANSPGRALRYECVHISEQKTCKRGLFFLVRHIIHVSCLGSENAVFREKCRKGFFFCFVLFCFVFLDLGDLKMSVFKKKGIVFVKADLKVWAQTCFGSQICYEIAKTPLFRGVQCKKRLNVFRDQF